ncbi:MAG: TetR/AcrR family transcriptional regulator [Armatimonadota bacterium]
MSEPQHNAEVVSSARERLLSAALDVLFERGYHGATSRLIASTAQVNEVTLFRLFSTKDDLLASAILNRAELDRAEVPVPTGDLEADLQAVAAMVSSTLFDRRQPLVRILPEIARLPAKQQALVRESIDATQARFMALFRYYQDLGQLCEGETLRIWVKFMGPILMAVQYAQSRQGTMPFDPVQHVRFFLHGCGTEQRQ